MALIEWNFWTCLSLRDAASIIYQLYCMFGILFKVFQPKKKVGWKMRKSRINKMCLIVEAGWWVQEDSISIKKREERRHTRTVSTVLSLSYLNTELNFTPGLHSLDSWNSFLYPMMSLLLTPTIYSSKLSWNFHSRSHTGPKQEKHLVILERTLEALLGLCQSGILFSLT